MSFADVPGDGFGIITEVNSMEAAVLLRSEEPLAHSPFIGSGCEIWNWLQSLKEEVSLDLSMPYLSETRRAPGSVCML
jgi:hypothetical protein